MIDTGCMVSDDGKNSNERQMTNHPSTKRQGMRLEQIAKVTVALVMSVALAACGYQLMGGLSAPQGVQSIAIPVLKNQTSESGIAMVFSNDLIYEFTRSKVLHVVDKNRADAVLSGTIVSMAVETVSYTAGYTSAERRVTICLNLTLKCRDGRVLWSDAALFDHESYKVSKDVRVTETNKRAAIGVIAERLAEEIHNRILQDF